MKPSKVYLEAARRIAEREDSFSCIAIKHVVHDGNHSYTKVPLARDYKNIFGFTDEDNFKREIERDNDGRNLRVLLLCLAAAMSTGAGADNHKGDTDGNRPPIRSDV